MADKRLSGKLAVILHADVVGSTRLVQQDEQKAHQRIQDTFQRFGKTIASYHGQVRELRGDALLAEFERGRHVRSATIKAESPCSTIRFSMRSMLAILKKYPSIRDRIQQIHDARGADHAPSISDD